MAKQINPKGLSSLTLGLHCDYHYQAVGLMHTAGAQVLHIEALLPAYSALVEQEASLVRRQTAYVSTERLNAADKTRDVALGVVMNVITAHKTNTIEEKRTAALALDAKVAPYRGIGNHEKRTQTREVSGLLVVLATDDAKAYIATLALTDEVAALAQYNAEVDAVLSGKLQEEVERMPQKDTDTEELRRQVDAKYAEIVQTVNAYAIVQPTEALENFIAQMNALISLTKPGTSSDGKNDGSADSGQGGGSTDSGGTQPDPEPTPAPEPTPNPTPDTGGGGYEDENGEWAG